MLSVIVFGLCLSRVHKTDEQCCLKVASTGLTLGKRVLCNPRCWALNWWTDEFIQEWKCQNKRDDKGKEKCVNYLASVGAYNPSCEKQLKQWASCDSTCNLCQSVDDINTATRSLTVRIL